VDCFFSKQDKAKPDEKRLEHTQCFPNIVWWLQSSV